MKKFNLLLAVAAISGLSLVTSCSKESDDLLSSKSKTTIGDDDNNDGLLNLDLPIITGINLLEGAEEIVVDLLVDDIIIGEDMGHLGLTEFHVIESDESTDVLSVLDQDGNLLATVDYAFEDGKWYEIVLTGDNTVEPYDIKVLELDYDFVTALLEDENGEFSAVNGLNLNADLQAVSIQTLLDDSRFATTIPSLADLEINFDRLSDSYITTTPFEGTARLVNSGSELIEDLVDGILVSIGSDEIFNNDLGVLRIADGDDYTVFVLGDAAEQNLLVVNLSEILRDSELNLIEVLQ